jgi:hypothetical protein
MNRLLNIMRLTLYAPLFYDRDDRLSPFAPAERRQETLFHFEIPQEQAFSIELEPDAGYLGTLRFAGTASAGTGGFALPAGSYLFAQTREELGAKEAALMAAEIQKEGLWEKRALTDSLYLRRLFEHGAIVTQLFRPFR